MKFVLLGAAVYFLSLTAAVEYLLRPSVPAASPGRVAAPSLLQARHPGALQRPVARPRAMEPGLR